MYWNLQEVAREYYLLDTLPLSLPGCDTAAFLLFKVPVYFEFLLSIATLCAKLSLLLQKKAVLFTQKLEICFSFYKKKLVRVSLLLLQRR